MAIAPETLRLYLVTDPHLCAGPALIETVEAAICGGVTIVQLRDKTASTQELAEAARALKARMAGTCVPLIVNDDIEAALASGADGAHVGQGDIDVTTARARLGPSKILGLSCETVEQVCAANPREVDYLGLGTVFPTATKADHKPTIGLAGLAEMAKAALLPNVAIGGLKASHVEGVFLAGCDGMAVVSAICGQPNPEQAAREMRRAISEEKGIIR